MDQVPVVRKGMEFSTGAPYLAPPKGIWYPLPGDGFGTYRAKFGEVRERLGDAMVERARILMNQYRAGSLDGSHPYIQHGMNFETVHIGTGGRWIELGPSPDGGICTFHNLDGHAEQILAFNLASDSLEFLDSEVLAPRIDITDGKYIPSYPLPKDLVVLPAKSNTTLTRDWLQERSRTCRLGAVLGIKLGEGEQTIGLESGTVHIREGFCKGYGFEGFNAVRATGLLAKLVDSCSFFED